MVVRWGHRHAGTEHGPCLGEGALHLLRRYGLTTVTGCCVSTPAHAVLKPSLGVCELSTRVYLPRAPQRVTYLKVGFLGILRGAHGGRGVPRSMGGRLYALRVSPVHPYSQVTKKHTYRLMSSTKHPDVRRTGFAVAFCYTLQNSSVHCTRTQSAEVQTANANVRIIPYA